MTDISSILLLSLVIDSTRDVISTVWMSKFGLTGLGLLGFLTQELWRILLGSSGKLEMEFCGFMGFVGLLIFFWRRFEVGRCNLAIIGKLPSLLGVVGRFREHFATPPGYRVGTIPNGACGGLFLGFLAISSKMSFSAFYTSLLHLTIARWVTEILASMALRLVLLDQTKLLYTRLLKPNCACLSGIDCYPLKSRGGAIILQQQILTFVLNICLLNQTPNSLISRMPLYYTILVSGNITNSCRNILYRFYTE